MEIVHRMWSTGPAGTVASCVSRRSYRGLRPKWAAGLIGACLLFAAGLAAAADVVTVSQGQLYLKMGNRPHWEYNGQTQALNTGPGTLTLKDSPQTLVATTGSPAAAGLLTGGDKRLLGIVGPGMNCGRIDPEESVTFALAGSSGLHFSAVDIALNAKFNATAKVEIYDGSSWSLRATCTRAHPFRRPSALPMTSARPAAPIRLLTAMRPTAVGRSPR